MLHFIMMQHIRNATHNNCLDAQDMNRLDLRRLLTDFGLFYILWRLGTFYEHF